MKKICAVVVTYNRADLLCRCIEKLFLQNYPMDIIVYDNHSTIDTKSALEKKGLLRDNLTYFYAQENTGGSGGFHNGMKMAMEKEYDALWLMDDDGYAIQKDTLSKIIGKWEEIGQPDCLLNSLVVCDEESQRLTFSLDREYDGEKMAERAENGMLEGLVSPFNGTFVTTGLVKTIGYPIRDFFVYGDETEYTLRLQRAGFKEYTVVDSLYYHPARVIAVKKILGHSIACGAEPQWKNYCAARNTIFFYKKYYPLASIVKKIIRIYVGCAITEGSKLQAFRVSTEGIADGLKGDFSKKLDLTK